MVDPAERREHWDQRYAADQVAFGIEPNVFVADVLGDSPPGRVLDMGCGQGRNAIWLAKRGHAVTAVDHSRVAIEQAEQRANHAGVEVAFVVADLMEWEPEPASYDVVLLSYLQLERARREVAHQRAVHAVAPGGTVVLIAHHTDNIVGGFGGPDRPDVLCTPADLARDFAAFDIQRNEAVLRAVTTPDGQQTAIDLLMIATKPG